MPRQLNPNNKKQYQNKWLGKYPGKTLHRLGTALGAIWATSTIINLIWPLPDQFIQKDSLAFNEMQVELLPNIQMSLLILGITNSQLGSYGSNSGMNQDNNLESVSLLEIQPNKQIKYVQVSPKKEIKLKGISKSKTLNQGFEEGGVALSADIVSESLQLPSGQPNRYLIAKPGTLKQVINKLGGIELSIKVQPKSNKRTQSLAMMSTKSRQRLNGLEIEKFLTTQANITDIKMKNLKINSVIEGLWRRIKDKEARNVAISLANEIVESMETNLTKKELRSLIMAIVRSPSPPKYVEFNSLYSKKGD